MIMIELDDKYVFHIPLYRCEDNELILIEMDDILDDLINQFHQNGFEGMYITQVKSYYRTRLYDEILITIFASGKSPVEIFEGWFRKNNDVLLQESFAYETENRLIICDLRSQNSD